MKSILAVLGLSIISLEIFAAPVSQETAKTAGKNFLLNEAQVTLTEDLTLAYTSVSNGHNNYYVFNSGHNFVMVSADDRAIPVLGYSTETAFTATAPKGEAAYLFSNYDNQINSIISNQIPATAEISSRWEMLKSGSMSQAKTGTLVAPVIKTLWDQMPYYNAMCPFDYNSNEQTVTGCVATAMAQVLRYWKYPKSGVGSYSYSDYQYGTQSAVFSNTTYDWDNMPNRISTDNTAIATLMYQCGVSVGMKYGTAANNGSAAYVIEADTKGECAEKALKSYFGYASTLKGVRRSSYQDADWIALLEEELNAHRPIIYAGFESTGAGHCFVFDGYNSSHPYFHINWGWSGSYNGFFSIDALNPGGVGTGGGTGDFNVGQQAIIGIQPADAAYTGIELGNTDNSAVSVYPNPAQDLLHVQIPAAQMNNAAVSLISINGQEVFSAKGTAGNSEMNISTASLPDGVYNLRITTADGVISRKVVVAK